MKSTLRPILNLIPALSLWLAGNPAYMQAAQAPSHFEIPATDDGLPGQGPIRRYDWFRKLWVERRTAWAEHAQQDQQSVVFLGDSITQGWGDTMGGKFGELRVANRGISGDTTRGVLIRLDEDVLALHPRAVVILIGTNDLEEGADPETIAANLKLLIGKLNEADPRMPIVLCQVFPSSESKKRPVSKIKKVNELYAAVVRGNPQVTLIETWALFANASGDAKPEEFPDLLHPNQAGYAKWAAAIQPIFATLGLVENEPDTFVPEPGFTSLFNGRDLTGWGYRPTSEADIRSAKQWQQSDPNAAAWPIVTKAVVFDGESKSADGRYVAKSGRLIVTTPTEGRRIQALWTTREFPGDFVLKLEFRATPNADSGVFIREPQLQCRDYLIAGPYKELQHYKAQDWNELVVEVAGGVARCTCNGELLEAALKLPNTGPIGLEGDRGQMEYRRIRIKQ
jgi:lysophospholipase L1-like esterase